MHSRTRDQIVEIIRENGPTSVKILVQKLGLTQAAIHRALNKLVESGHLVKKGSVPKVFYALNPGASALRTADLKPQELKLLSENYLYIDPTGKTKEGLEGFVSWMTATKNKQSIEN